MIKALGEPGLCGRHLASWSARPGLVSRQKWGCGDQRGRVTGAPDPPAGAEPPSVALGPPGALCGVTVSAPAPPKTYQGTQSQRHTQQPHPMSRCPDT